ncbi:16551_t:CDS:1, partial [Cetraspora pellucida]
MASPTEPSTHLLFAHQSKKSQSNSTLPSFSVSPQVLSSLSSLQVPSSSVLLQTPLSLASLQQASSSLTSLQIPSTFSSSTLSSIPALLQPNPMQQSNFLQQPVYPGQYYIPPPFYNPFISYFPSQIYGLPQMPIQSLQSIIKPTIQDFLKYVDECE